MYVKKEFSGTSGVVAIGNADHCYSWMSRHIDPRLATDIARVNGRLKSYSYRLNLVGRDMCPVRYTVCSGKPELVREPQEVVLKVKAIGGCSPEEYELLPSAPVKVWELAQFKFAMYCGAVWCGGDVQAHGPLIKSTHGWWAPPESFYSGDFKRATPEFMFALGALAVPVDKTGEIFQLWNSLPRMEDPR